MSLGGDTVGPFYLPGEVKYPTQGANTCVTCRGLYNSEINSCVSLEWNLPT